MVQNIQETFYTKLKRERYLSGVLYYVPNFKNNVEKIIFQTAAAKQNGTKEKHLAFEVTSVDELWKCS